MGYCRGTLNYLERITLFDLTHTMSMAYPVAIGLEALKIDNEFSSEKNFTKLIRMNP